MKGTCKCNVGGGGSLAQPWGGRHQALLPASQRPVRSLSLQPPRWFLANLAGERWYLRVPFAFLLLTRRSSVLLMRFRCRVAGVVLTCWLVCFYQQGVKCVPVFFYGLWISPLIQKTWPTPRLQRNSPMFCSKRLWVLLFYIGSLSWGMF